MLKNNFKNFTMLNKLHEKEKQYKHELSKTFLEYLDNLPSNKRIEQMQSLLYETEQRNLPTLDRCLTLQERKCLHLASQGKEIKETANILGLSQRTIKYHRANIIKKLDVSNLMAAVSLRSSCYNAVNEIFSEIPHENYYLLSDDQKKPLEINFTKNLIELVPGNVFIVDIQGYTLWCNQRILDTLRLKSLSDYIGKHIGYWDSYSWECCKDIIKSKKEITGKESYHEHYYITTRKPLFSKKNKIIAILGAALEITD